MAHRSFATAKWIVDPIVGAGTHTTIASALTSASSGQTIFIRPGTYTENLTLKAGVNLASYISESLTTAHVTIVGTCTFTGAGSVVISGIRLQTNSAAFLAVTGTAASIVRLLDCTLICADNTGITYSSSDSGSGIQIIRCLGNISTTGIALFTHTASGGLNFEYTHITNTGASTTSSTSSGAVSIQWSLLSTPLTTSSAGSYGIFYSSIVDIGNTACVTTAGTGSVRTYHSNFESGSASAFSIGAGTTGTINECTIISSNTNAITGAGTVNYSGINFTGSSNLINTTTVVGQVNRPGITLSSQQPCFLADITATSAAITGDGTLATMAWTNEVFDQGGNFASNTFTAPYTGRYFLTAQICGGSIGASHSGGSIQIATTNRTFLGAQVNPTAADDGGQYTFSVNCIADMNASDTAVVKFIVSGSTKTVTAVSGGATDPRTWFAGHLLC